MSFQYETSHSTVAKQSNQYTSFPQKIIGKYDMLQLQFDTNFTRERILELSHCSEELPIFIQH